MLAVADPQAGVTVWGSMQCPYYIHRALAGLFNLPSERVRVVQMETGGGFGGKEEYPSILAGHAALLAWKAGRPGEDGVRPARGHGRHDQAASGANAASHGDRRRTGAWWRWTSSSSSTAARTARCPPSSCRAGRFTPRVRTTVPNVRVRSKAVATTTPPHGAFRGFGAPQSIFALELQMDRVAAAAGLPADEFRRRNFISDRPGERRRADRARAGGHAAAPRSRLRAVRISREVRAVRRAGTTGSLSPRHRLRLLHARGGLHRLRRAASGLGRERRGRRRRPHPRARGQHRNRSGNEHDLRADRVRRSRHRLRRRRGGAARYGGGARQRADRRLAHVHGGRQARGERSARPEIGAVGRGPAARDL